MPIGISFQNNIFPLMCNLIPIEKNVFSFDQTNFFYSCGRGLTQIIEVTDDFSSVFLSHQMTMPEHGSRTPCPSPGLRSTETANKTSTTNFEFHPIFPVSVHFPPCFAKIIIYFPPTLKNSSPVFEKFTCFLYNLCVFRFPLL